jgi:hypothetical protein
MHGVGAFQKQSTNICAKRVPNKIREISQLFCAQKSKNAREAMPAEIRGARRWCNFQAIAVTPLCAHAAREID